MLTPDYNSWLLNSRATPVMRPLTVRLLVSIGVALFFTFVEWSGYGERFKMTGIPNPKDFADIWWHFFVWLAVFYAMAALGLIGKRE